MSPLAFGPGRGTHRVLGVAGTQERCRTHQVPLGPVKVPGVLEAAASLSLVEDAAARLAEEGLTLPQARPLPKAQARCPECVASYATTAAARVHGDEDQ